MLIDLATVQGFLTNPSVIADIFTVTLSSLILISNFNKGFITSLLKIVACYICGVTVIPVIMNFAVPGTNVPTALAFSIVTFLIFAFILTSIVDRLTPYGSYSIMDSILGLIFGLFEVILLLFVICASQAYLKKNQNIEIPQWSQTLDNKNITGVLLGLVRPYSDQFINYFSDANHIYSLQSRIQTHLGIVRYFKMSAPTINS